MKFKGLAILALAFLVVGAFTYDASASACRHPASLLLFPHFKTDGKNLSVITITNTGPEDIVLRIVWVYKDKGHCIPADTWIEMTRNDTFTFMDRDLFFEDEEGFSYVYVVDDLYSDAEVDYDYLIGQECVFSAEQEETLPFVVNYSINAVGFEALDVNGDGLLELDGNEYTLAPAKLMFPRFFGQPDAEDGEGQFKSRLIFVNLTGGKFYDITTKFLIFNDNEKGYSRTVQFDCWKKQKLTSISGVFENSYLLGTDHAEFEPLGFHDVVETGWFYFYGEQAYYDILSIDNPSAYAVLIETIGAEFGSADLPWQIESPNFDHGSLYPTVINP